MDAKIILLMKRFSTTFLFLVIILGSYVASGQKPYLLIQRLDKPSVTRRIVPESQITVGKAIIEDSINQRSFYATGILKGLASDSLKIWTSDDWIYNILSDGSSLRKEYEYEFDYDKPKTYRYFEFDDIIYIKYMNPERKTLHNISIAMICISSITAGILAPVISYNFDKKEFNSKRYVNCLKAGFIGLSIGIPVAFLTKERNAYFGDYYKEYFPQWRIVGVNYRD